MKNSRLYLLNLVFFVFFLGCGADSAVISSSDDTETEITDETSSTTGNVDIRTSNSTSPTGSTSGGTGNSGSVTDSETSNTDSESTNTETSSTDTTDTSSTDGSDTTTTEEPTPTPTPTPPPEEIAILVRDFKIQTMAPSELFMTFEVTDENGGNYPNLNMENFRIFENTTEVKATESLMKIINLKDKDTGFNGFNFNMYTLLLIDMSGSVSNSGRIEDLKLAINAYLDKVHNKQKTAIYIFDGRSDIIQVADFTSDTALLKLAAAATFNADYTIGDPSANLYGGVIKALETINAVNTSVFPKSIVFFTDGPDQAGVKTKAETVTLINNTKTKVFSIGMGDEVVVDELKEIGKSGYFHTASFDTLKTTFEEVGNKLVAVGDSFYMMAYCSPKRDGSGTHKVKIRVNANQKVGNIEEDFTATGFLTGCTSTIIADLDRDGLSNTYEFSNDSNPLIENGWAKVTETPAVSIPREMHTAIAKDSLWIIGGKNGATEYNKFFRSEDGFTWDTTFTLTPSFSIRSGHSSVDYLNKIWVIGGKSGGTYKKDVYYWSETDAAITTGTDNAAFSGRQLHSTAVFKSKIWLYGGETAAAAWSDEIWSTTDGIIWSKSPKTLPQKRFGFVSLVFNNKMFILGGKSDATTYLTNVISSVDGETFTEVIADAGLSGLFKISATVFDKKLWVAGGVKAADGKAVNDLWFSENGKNWFKALIAKDDLDKDITFEARYSHALIPFDNRLWIIGGNSGSAVTGNVWYYGR